MCENGLEPMVGTRPFSGEMASLAPLTVLSTRIVARIGSAVNLSKDIADVSYGCGYQPRVSW
jgi:hypothetical protein